eukprot:2549802-Amphidinium_carterae.1
MEQLTIRACGMYQPDVHNALRRFPHEDLRRSFEEPDYGTQLVARLWAEVSARRRITQITQGSLTACEWTYHLLMEMNHHSIQPVRSALSRAEAWIQAEALIGTILAGPPNLRDELEAILTNAPPRLLADAEDIAALVLTLATMPMPRIVDQTSTHLTGCSCRDRTEGHPTAHRFHPEPLWSIT